MNSRLHLAAILLLLLSITHAASGQVNTPVFGYPYSAHQAEGTGTGYPCMFYGSDFQLNGSATITFISCKMYIGYDISSSNETSSYRFAIYHDNGGKVGELIAQTESGTVIKPADAQLPLQLDDFQTLSFSSPVSLQADTYWLTAAIKGPNLMVYNDLTTQPSLMARCSLTSTTFPSTLTSIQYINNQVCAIYASGTGASSVMPLPSVEASNPGLSSLSVNCQSIGSATNGVEVFGSLSVYGASIPQAAIDFSYRTIDEKEWHQLGTTNTNADGSYSIDWTPPTQSSYLINATYWGNSTTSPTFKAVPVLITPPNGNQSQTVFSIDSNSAVTNLAFDSANAQLSFSVTGENGTTGYADVCIGKGLVADASTIQAFIDGNPANFTVSSTADSWILQFSYHHSSHNVQFDLKGGSNSSVPEIPKQSWFVTIIPLFVLALIILKVTKTKMHNHKAKA
jgi:hypothetical protein